MTTLEFLSYLRGLDIRVWVEGDKLRFRAPESALTPSLRAELGKRKADIIEFLSQTTDDVISEAPPMVPLPRDREFPLSFSQERLWFLDQLDPGSAAYNIHSATRFQGPLAVEVLERCLNEMVLRHESLRTTFKSVDGRAVQVIAPYEPFPLTVLDLSGLDETARLAELERLATAEAQQPFDLSRGPLLRVRLIRLAPQDHVWIENIHHIVSDDWSMKVFTNELAELYKSYVQGKPSPLAELPIQYADFAHWQREWLQGEVLDSQVAYWKKQLGGNLPVLQMPTDHPRPSNQTFRGTQAKFLLPTSFYAALKTLCDREGVTLFMLMLAAFQTLLHRYTNQEDIIVGSPIAGRSQIETEKIIGFFLNTLVLRTDLSGRPTFRELLARVREVCLGAYAHQEIPFEPLLEQLRIKRDLSRTPLFQTMLVLLNTPVSTPTSTADMMGLTFSPVKIDNGTTKFDLSLSLTETGEGIDGVLDFNLDLFDPPTIGRLLGHFKSILETVVRDPAVRLHELPLLSAAEEEKLLVEWNDTETPYSEGACLHQLVEAQVERTPEAVAVVCENEQLTYRELDTKANQLAHHLRGLGVGAEVRVGICMERSLELIVAMLGVLKAGAAYLPLDPLYSKERLGFALADAQVPVLLTQERLVEILPQHDALAICLDTGWEEIGSRSESRPDSEAAPDSVAIVLYTSGSTGTPKGALLPHRALVNYVEAANENYQLTPADRVLQFGSISFDLSAEEIYPTLSTGATLVLRDNPLIDAASTFLQKCEGWGVTVLDLPTLYWHELTTRIHDEDLSLYPALRIVIIGGEKALPEQVALWHRRAGAGVRLINTYGPTEATIAATRCDLETPPEDNGALREVPIGRPINNVQVYILDAQLRPTPVGVPGELHIGGVGLVRGYHNRPALTAERFIPNPFAREGGGARLYRTGDQARYLPDGQIEYVGRIDRQVKIRGFRVELGEIEFALAQHADVHEAVVVVLEDDPEQKRLAAYVVCSQGREPSVGELRRFLRERLPDYMVPSHFVFLDQFPLNTNGKVDRDALPEPDRTRFDGGEGFVAPRTETEKILAGIWADLLRVEQVGVFDDFFELGGHSLLAMRITSRVREAFGVEVPLRAFFLTPNVEGLAEAVEAARREGRHEDNEIKQTLDVLENLSEEEVRAMLLELQNS
jgi:aspartate racemase